MQALQSLTRQQAAKIRFVLSDIDDTITTEGRLTGRAYAALEKLSAAGLVVIPITGRPAGWCDHIARMWPVFAVVGENGAFYMRYDHSAKKMLTHHFTHPAQRQINRQKLNELADKILRAVPGCGLASDQNYREADLAIDFCEDVTPLDESAVQMIVSIFQQAGAQAKVSSIHVNGWFGDYDKLAMTQTLFTRECGLNLREQLDTALFIGDSPNDEPMFKFFDLSVGVANIQSQLHRLKCPPKFVTRSKGGDGFVEMAEFLLRAKSSSE
ncbi:HAD-IIB family hydrolase [Zwartia vadi]|uniref:HAD-IIB family hydrolase n=1 Tax=Zwartia vadi TaxID=3058168 RepID=UPI0025B3EF84|nr:HAD-IIB family hydrolase [Zwartia vadi]MDN3988469.1 HAD-IIB family hydrolase [Zwartia vadi]